MKKPLLIIIILLLVGIGVAFFVKFPKTHITDTQVQETQLSGNTEVINSGDNQELTGSTITTGDENPLVYTNTEFGFQLTLPEGWEDYKAFVYHHTGKNTIAKVVITLPTNSSRPGVDDPNDKNLLIAGYTGQYKSIIGYAGMIYFNIYTHHGYDIAINTPDMIWDKNVRIQHTVGSGINYVYTFLGPTDLPNDLITIWGDRDYFKTILDSFRTL